MVITIAVGLTSAVVVTLAVVAALKPSGPGWPPADEAVDLRTEVRDFVMEQSMHRYRPADAQEREAFGRGTAALMRGRSDTAADVFREIGYRVRIRADVGGAKFAEAYDAGSGARGWGRVLVDLRARPRVVVEVPHPGADRDSEQLGVALFRHTPGAVLLVAGAHRRAAPDADVAHAESSVFETAHEQAVAIGLPVLQLHGFAAESAKGQDVVISAGPRLSGSLARRLADSAEGAGFAVCRSWSTGCPGLEGTTNVQAKWSDRHRGSFVHVEVAPAPREDAATASRLAVALSAACGQDA